MSRPLFLMSLLVMFGSGLSALEGQAPYLRMELRGDWFEQPVQQVVEQCAERLGVSTRWSAAAQQQQQQVMSLLTTRAHAAQELLPRIEELAGLMIRCEAEQMHIMAIDEARQLVMRVYSLQALIQPRLDFPGPELGRGGGQGTINLFSDFGPEPDLGLNPEDVTDYILSVVEPDSWDRDGVAMSMHNGHLVVTQTPRLHRLVAQTLSSLEQQFLRTVHYRVTAGLRIGQPPDQVGLVSRSVGDAVLARLEDKRTLNFFGADEQRCSAAAISQQSLLIDLDVAGEGFYDPVVDTINTGLAGDLRAMMSVQSFCEVRLSWAEILDVRRTTVQRGGRTVPGAITVNGDIETKVDKEAEGASQGELSGTGTMSPPSVVSGEKHELDLPVVWVWRPQAEILLSHDRDLLLSARRPDGRYAILHLRVEDGSPALVPGQPQAVNSYLRTVASEAGLDLAIAARPAAWAAPVIDPAEVSSWTAFTESLAGHNWQLRLADGLVLHPGPTDGLLVKHYDIRHLARGLTDFPGPRLSLPEPGSSSAMFIPEIADDNPLNASDVMNVIDEVVSLDGDGQAMDTYKGRLVVSATKAQHAAIDSLLTQLADNPQRLVAVYEVPERHAAGVLDAEGWASIDDAAMLGQTLLSRGQRNHIFVGTQTNYLADADRVDGTLDPIITTASSGLVVDVTLNQSLGHYDLVLRLQAAGEQKVAPSSVVESGVQSLPVERLQHDFGYAEGNYRLPPGGAVIIAVGQRRFAISVGGAP